MTEKYFDRREAEELLPLIGSFLEEARDQKQVIDGFDEDIARAASRIMVLGGSIPPYGELGKKKAEREKVVASLQQTVAKITETGCVVKDLDEGLVDFPSLLKGQEVYLCWKLGEKRIGYWHGLDEGFAGRKPLDDSSSDEPPSGPTRLH